MVKSILVLATVSALHAQSPLPDTPTLARTVQGLRRAAGPADPLIQEATTLLEAGQSGEARRRLAHAQALLTGKTWEAREEWLWSLALRPERYAMDSGLPQTVELAQVYAAPFQPAAPLRLRLGVIASASDSKLPRPVGSAEVPPRDLAADPLRIQADLAGTLDGAYHLTATVFEGDAPLTTLQQNIGVAEGIESRYPDVERRLAKVAGHESAKATVRWPFDI